MQAAWEMGMNLTNGCNGHLIFREAGSVGGQKVMSRMTGTTVLPWVTYRPCNIQPQSMQDIS